MDIAYHFITLNYENIFVLLEKKENSVIDECELKLKNINHFHKNNEKIDNDYQYKQLLPTLVTINDILPRIVIKKFQNIISVYPIFTKMSQMDNYSKLLYFDSRSIIYKYGWLLIYYNNMNKDNDLFIELYIKKNNLANAILKKETMPKNFLNLSIESIIPQEIKIALAKIDITNNTSINFNIPMFLPSDWEREWNIYKKTQFLTFCI